MVRRRQRALTLTLSQRDRGLRLLTLSQRATDPIARTAISSASRRANRTHHASQPPPDAVRGQPLRPGEWEPSPGSSAGEKRDDKDKDDDDKFGKHPKPKPVASKRGEDWALREAGRGSVGVTRPMRVECYADRLVVVSDRGPGGDKVVPLGPRTASSIDLFISAVWEQMGAWGMAGRGMYWRPVLQVRVAPGAERRFCRIVRAAGRQRAERWREDSDSSRPIPQHAEPVNGDSFLDIVASVVSIMIIMVVMEGIRIKNAPVTVALPATPADAELEKDLAAEQSLRGDVWKMAEEIRGVQREAAVRGTERDLLATTVSAVEHQIQERRQRLDGVKQADFDLARNLAESKFQLDQLAARAASRRKTRRASR